MLRYHFPYRILQTAGFGCRSRDFRRNSFNVDKYLNIERAFH